jgi:monofunctional biosynthetic peptidoglycan transglycosylase
MARGIGKGLVWRGRGWLWRLVAVLFILLVPAPILLLLIFRFLPIPGTPEMLVSLIEGKGASYSWSDDISPRLERAVIGPRTRISAPITASTGPASTRRMEDHKRHPDKPMRGASTISSRPRAPCSCSDAQLDPQGAGSLSDGADRRPVAQEAHPEAYLNLVDWGDGISAPKPPAEAYFGTDAAIADSAQAARLAAILPNPHKWKAAHPGRYVRRRAGHPAGAQRHGGARRTELLR